jgi:hypothetical protein
MWAISPFHLFQDGLHDLDWLCKQPITERGDYFVHVEFDHPLIVRMDGKTGLAVIQK